MQWILPGTVLEADQQEAEHVQALLQPMFLAGGMVLSQVSSITGLEPYIIQNWVKRGYLQPPRGKRYDMEQVCRILNINLLKGALTLEQAPPRFHARLSAVGKTYVYRIWNSPVPDVFARRFRVCVPQRLDEEAMRRAAADLVGTHDFTSFCVRGKKSAVRTLTELSVRREGDALTLTFSADGFLHHMVRILTGTLLEVGLGKRPAGSMPALLAEKRRAAAGQTAPAAGLCLMEVRYP